MNFLQKFAPKKVDKILLAAFAALGIVALLISWSSQPLPEKKEVTAEAPQIDTMIPAGYLLIPIRLANGESLASLSGDFALIDLYSVSEKGRKGVKVASGVKLLKAPLNPEQFAVLMKEEDSGKLVQMEGPFFAALKNPSDRSKPAAIKAQKNFLTIHYGG